MPTIAHNGQRVIVRLQRLFFNFALLVAALVGAACDRSTDLLPPWNQERIEPQIALPVVEYAEVEQRDDNTLRWTVRFSQPMSETTVGAFEVRQVVAAEQGGNNQGKAVATTLVSGQDTLWHITASDLDLVNSGYFLRIDKQAVNRSELVLDGAAGEVSGNVGRSDEDYYKGGEAFVSLSTGPTDLRRSWTTRRSYDRPYVRQMRLYFQRNSGEPYNDRWFEPFRTPFDGGRIVPAQVSTQFVIRLTFGGSTRYEAMLDPASLTSEIRVVSDSGGAMAPLLAYNPNPNMLMEAGLPYPVTGYATVGTTVVFWFKTPLAENLVGQGIGFNAEDRPYLFVGEEAVGKAPVLPVYQWDNGKQELTAGRSLGQIDWVRTGKRTIGFEKDIVPVGWFHDRMEVSFGGGATALVIGTAPQRFLLDRDLPVTDSSGSADLLFLPIETSVPAFDKVHFVADYLYVLPSSIVNEGQRYRLVFGIQTPPVNILGMPLSDRYRDGNERRENGRNDRLSFFFSVQDLASFPVPRTMLLNNGALYPMVFAKIATDCTDDRPICVHPKTLNGCLQDEILMSFYTPDGDEESPMGTQDLIRGSIKSEPVYLMRNRKDGSSENIPSVPVPLLWQVDTVFVPPPGGPSSLLRIWQEDCQPLQRGDLLVLRHSLQAQVPGKKYTFDGNGDGVLQDSSEDDLIRYYAGSPTGFVTLEEFRQ